MLSWMLSVTGTRDSTDILQIYLISLQIFSAFAALGGKTVDVPVVRSVCVVVYILGIWLLIVFVSSSSTVLHPFLFSPVFHLSIFCSWWVCIHDLSHIIFPLLSVSFQSSYYHRLSYPLLSRNFLIFVGLFITHVLFSADDKRTFSSSREIAKQVAYL